MQFVVNRLRMLQQLVLPEDLFINVSVKFLRRYQQRVSVEAISHLKRHPARIVTPYWQFFVGLDKGR